MASCTAAQKPWFEIRSWDFYTFFRSYYSATDLKNGKSPFEMLSSTLLSHTGDKLGKGCSDFFQHNLMNVPTSLFTTSYCYRVQLAEAFSEGKTMQLLKAMENCPAKSTNSSPAPGSLSRLALPKSKSSRSHTSDTTQQIHSQSWQRHLVPPTHSWRLPLLPSHHLAGFSYSLTSQFRHKPTKTTGASSKAVKSYNSWWYLKIKIIIGKTVSVLQSCSPLTGTSEPAHPRLTGTSVRAEEMQGSSAEQTGARDGEGQHLGTALAALFPTQAFLFAFFAFFPFC